MAKITTPLLVEDFYKTTLSLDINPSGDVELTVTTPPANTKGFIIVDPDSSSNRERMYYHDVIGNVIYVKGVNRVDPKQHFALDKVQINDTSLIFNYLSKLQSTTFYVEQLGVLSVNILGGPVLQGVNTISVSDTLITIIDASINYIYYKASTNEIKTTVTETAAATDKGIIVAEITAVGGAITSIAYRQHKLVAGNSIDTIIKTDTTILVDTYTITYTDGLTSTFTVTNGRGIDSISKTNTTVLVDTYTIIYNDTTTSTFTVTNGRGIDSITLTATSADGLTHTYTITYNDTTTSTFNIVDGNGITSISKTGTIGLVDTYTITFQDTTTTTFTVTNGLDGKNVLNGTVDPTAEGVDGDFYINTVSNYIFGPKASGIWGTGISLVGPTGPATSWGLISGTLSDQTDLQNEFNNKLSIIDYNSEKNVFSASSTGTDDYVITDTSLTAYNDGQPIRFRVDIDNTGPATLEINSLGAIPLKKNQGNDYLITGDIKANGIVTAVYNSVLDVFQFTGQEATVVSIPVETTKSTLIAGENIVAGEAVRNGDLGMGGSPTNAVIYNYEQDIVTGTSGNEGAIISGIFTVPQLALELSQISFYLGATNTTYQYIRNIRIRDGSSTGTLLYEYTNATKVTSTTVIKWDFSTPTISLDGITTLYVEFQDYDTLNNSGVNLIHGEDLNNNLSIEGLFSFSIEDENKIYKTDASDINKIGFIGFADNTVSIGDNIFINTAGINNNNTSIIVGKDYYLQDVPGSIGTTPGTIYFNIGKGILNNSILIKPLTTGFKYIASTNYKDFLATEKSNSTTTYVKLKEIAIAYQGTCKVSFDLKAHSTSYYAYGLVYINGVSVGTLRSNNSTTYITYTEDFIVQKGDLLQVYAKTAQTLYYAYIQNFNIGYDVQKTFSIDDNIIRLN